MYKTISVRQGAFKTPQVPSVKFTDELKILFPLLIKTLESKQTSDINLDHLNKFLEDLDRTIELDAQSKSETVLKGKFELIFKAYNNYPKQKFEKKDKLEIKASALAYLYLATQIVSDIQKVIEYESERLPQQLALHRDFISPDIHTYTATDKLELSTTRRKKVLAASTVSSTKEEIRQSPAPIKKNSVAPVEIPITVLPLNHEIVHETTVDFERTKKISWAEKEDLVQEKVVETQFKAPKKKVNW